MIERYVRSARPGIIEGVLVDLGAFPALVPGDGLVKGVLLELNQEAQAITDRLEGYHPDPKERTLFLRKVVLVRLDDGEQAAAWVYEYADPASIEDRPQLVIGQIRGLSTYNWRSYGKQ